MPIATALLTLLLVGCDSALARLFRNDLDQDVVVKIAFGSGELRDAAAGPLRPGHFITVATVGVPGEHPTLLVKAFDVQGNLLFCRRLGYDAYSVTPDKAPLSIRPGQPTCS